MPGLLPPSVTANRLASFHIINNTIEINRKSILAAANFPTSNTSPWTGSQVDVRQLSPVNFKTKLRTGIIKHSEMAVTVFENAAPRMKAIAIFSISP